MRFPGVRKAGESYRARPSLKSRAHSHTHSRAQVWVTDYTIGFLLFLFTLLIVGSILSHTVLTKDTFPDLLQNTESVSEHLMSTGYPIYWRANDVVEAGFLTKGELSVRKAEEFAKMDYPTSKNVLQTDGEYALTLENKSGEIFPIGNRCFFGSSDVSVTKTIVSFNKSVAYYYLSSGSADLLPNLTQPNATINGTIYHDDELNSLLGNATKYDMIIMEDPNLATIKSPYDSEKQSALENFVLRGGRLVLIGDVNLTGLFNLNLSTINGTISDSDGVASNDTFLNLSTLKITNIPSDASTISSVGQKRYESISKLDDGTDFAATFTYGDGDVYYLGSLKGDLSDGETLLDHVLKQLSQEISSESANCTDLIMPQDVKNLVTVKRLIVHKGNILTLKVYGWEVK